MLNYRKLFWPLCVLLLLRSGLELWQYNLRVTDNDQSLYWLAAHDLAAGRSIPAFVYGQDYNYFVEPWLAALPVKAGLSPVYVLPVATACMALLPFLMFAWYARRNNLHGGAALWLLIPLLLPSGWYIVTAMPRGFVNGLFLFACWPPVQNLAREKLRWLLSGILAAVAFCVNANTLPLAVALLVLTCWPHLRRGAMYFLHLAGAVPVFVAHHFITQHAQQQAGGLLHPKWTLQWTADYFAQGITHISQWLRWLVPGNASLWLLLPLLILLTWLCIYQQRRSLLFALAAVLLVLVLSLGINKLHDGREHLHYPFSRMWLALPLLAGALAERVKLHSRIALSVFAVCAVAACFSIGAPHTNSQAPELPLRIMRIDSLKAKSDELTLFIRTEKINTVVGLGYPEWVGDQQLLFHYTEINSVSAPLFVIPEYERRRTLLSKEIQGKILVLGGDEGKWIKMGEIQRKVNVCGMSGALLRK
ncbi:MAG: hypothetical protein MUC87_02810 [Bacteroidia bacterium]|jgi:hypothetical protein|nr:hypothetical protein [Bacteroidia bacterium]